MQFPKDLTDLLSASGDVAYDWDLLTDTIVWHGPWKKLFHGEVAPPDSQALYQVLHEDDRHIVFGGETHAIDRQFRIQRGSEGSLWVHERGACESDGHQAVRQCGIWRLIEQPTQTLPASEGQNRDSLTGCLKRRALQTHLTRAIDNAKSTRRIGAYMVVGVDKMSFVNEAIGTEGGDALLRGVTNRLSQLVPRRAVIGRVNGDVFGILLPEPLGNELQSLSERIMQDFRNAPVIAVNTPMHITVSIGGVRIPTVAGHANEAMIFAEQALHMARQRGHNTSVEYVDSPQRAQENRKLLELSERIKHAFKVKSFRLAYQPIVEAGSGRPHLYEVLVRMFGDDNQPVAAALFVPMIEQMGLGFELDRLVLDLAIADMEASPHLRLAINVSGLTASHAEWPEHLKRVLASRREVAHRIVFEITETAAIVDIGETKRFVDTACALGAQVALDDFGAGSTSIRYLRELAISVMKIDKEMLKDLTTNKEQQHLVRVLIDLARGLGIKTVAEGIETEEVAAWMRDAKVDYLQGYYFGKPTLERPESAPVETVTASTELLEMGSFAGAFPTVASGAV